MPLKGDAKSPPLRAGIEDQLPKQRNARGHIPVVYPSVGKEARAIKEGEYQVYTVPGCDEYRCLISPDPMGQYKALVMKEKAMPGIVRKDELFWSPIRANAHTGPAIRGFDDTLLALAYAQDWLLARVQGKLRTEANRKAFLDAKKKEKTDHYDKGK